MEEYDLLKIFTEDDDVTLDEYCKMMFSVDEIFTKVPKEMRSDLFLYQPSIFCVACFLKSYKCVSYMIAQNVDVFYQDRKQRTPFLFAIAGGSLPIIQLLIENGSDINDTDIDGNGAVHYAVKYNQRALILWLCYGLGLDLSMTNNKLESPLHTAASEMKTEVIQILCSHGADVNLRTCVL